MDASHVSKTFHDMLKTMFGNARETTKNIWNYFGKITENNRRMVNCLEKKFVEKHHP